MMKFNDHSQDCHAERSEASAAGATDIRSAAMIDGGGQIS
jgi:hypothetical protein